MKILVTGATGFVGSALLKRLQQDTVKLIAAVSEGKDHGKLPMEVERVYVQSLSGSCDYSTALENVDSVIHLAARVHVMRETASDPLKAYRTVNTEATAQLARQAARAGVKRFVFMSTIGVNGNTSNSKPFSENDPPSPHNPYSISKSEAEESLAVIAAETGIEIVVVRAPLVYGPCNPGNFLSLLHAVSKKFPLPFASIKNERSLLYVGNLVDALAHCTTHSNAAGKTYLVSDGEDVSTPELIKRVAVAMGKPAYLFSFPPNLMRLAGAILGKGAAVNQLIGTLAIDSTKIRRELDWHPPFTMKQGLAETVKWFKKEVLNSEL